MLGLAALVLIGVVIAILALVFVALLFAAVCACAGWLIWQVVPSPSARARFRLDQLTSQYVAGRFDIHEFEQRLDHVLTRE